jgi:alkyl hydroperoxide reductase subunit AhpF
MIPMSDMTKEAFEVIVSESGDKSESAAIASASQYLAYGDHSDTFGDGGDIFDVTVYGGGKDSDYGIGIHFSAHMDDPQLKLFMDEMALLNDVESVERISYQEV